MIEQLDCSASTDVFELRLRPNRSITAAGMAAFFGLLATASIVVAAFSASQGNVFAPPFAVLELLAVGWALRYVWRLQARRQEHIALTRDALTVAWPPPREAVSFHPYWVRLISASADGDDGRRRLLLSSHGRSIEIGAFLGDDEREQLRRQLAGALAALRETTVTSRDSACSG